MHRDVKAGNILVDFDGSIKLGDFGVSAPLYDTNFESKFKEIAGTPYWMAPEVIHSHNGYGYKADIWSFGITALELAHGRPPLSHLPPSKSLLFKITKRFRFSDYDKEDLKGGNNKKFSKGFKDLVGLCLNQDPWKRPTAERLLKHGFFKNCKSCDFLVKNVLMGLPSVEERFMKSKMVRVPSIRSEEGEETMREIEKQRRVSGWNFNFDGFELDPVYPGSIQKTQLEGENSGLGQRRVWFHGELVIPEKRVDSEVWSMSSPPPASISTPTEELSSVERVEGPSQEQGQSAEGGVDRESMVAGLVTLRGSLDEQRKNVKELIAFLGGEQSKGGETNSEEQMMGEMVERLKRELEQERRKNKELLMELEFLKVVVSGSQDG